MGCERNCPCGGCGVDEAYCYEISRWKKCEKYKSWLNWNWERFKTGFYALKAKQEGAADRMESGLRRIPEPRLEPPVEPFVYCPQYSDENYEVENLREEMGELWDER